MENAIIIVIIVVLVWVGARSTVKHMKGQGSCCGGGGTYVSKKKLRNVTARKTALVEGMTCENCKARVERAINDLDGLAGQVNLRKKEVRISMERDVDDEVIRTAIEKAGYTVVEIR